MSAILVENCGPGFTGGLYSARMAGGMPWVDENGATFAENARLKATALFGQLPEGGWSMADDSGIVVDALGGAPGIHSARYAGIGATDAENTEKLLRELGRAGAFRPEQRTARFVCALVLIGPDRETQVFEGRCEGNIIDTPRGKHGFGYDPVFVPRGDTRTFAEIPSAEKNEISHRALALKALLQWATER